MDAYIGEAFAKVMYARRTCKFQMVANLFRAKVCHAPTAAVLVCHLHCYKVETAAFSSLLMQARMFSHSSVHKVHRIMYKDD
jgi:hypothetical protein